MSDEYEEAGSSTEPGQGANPATSAAGGAAQPVNDARDEMARFEHVPLKHRAFKEDGTFDAEETLMKVSHARNSLEQRLGTGDIRPKTAEEYVLNLSEEHQQYEEALAPDQVKAFQAEAHAAGFTQEQYDFVLAKYLDVLPVMARGFRASDEAAAREELSQTWKTPAEFQANLTRANSAIRAYAGDDADGIFRDYGNDPRIARAFARIGAEMGEGRAPTNAQASSAASLDDLRSSEAYRNAKHPDHARVSEQVSAMSQRIHGRERVA